MEDDDVSVTKPTVVLDPFGPFCQFVYYVYLVHSETLKEVLQKL